jgi:hypothetical protein
VSVLARGVGYHQAYNLAAYRYSSTRKDDYWIFVVFTILAMSGLDVLVLLSYLPNIPSGSISNSISLWIAIYIIPITIVILHIIYRLNFRAILISYGIIITPVLIFVLSRFQALVRCVVNGEEL